MARSPTLDLILVTIAVFLLQVLFRFAYSPEVAIAVLGLARPFAEAPWTLITSVYAHGGVGHLLSNIILVVLVGLVIERHTSWPRFQGFVLGSGALAGVAQTLVTGGVVLGLSGGAFALLGYALTSNRLADLLAVGSRTLQVGALVTVAGVITLVTYAPGVALVGHFVGLVVGLVAGRYRLLAVA